MLRLSLILLLFSGAVKAAPIGEIQELMQRYYTDQDNEISHLSYASDNTINEEIKKIDPWANWLDVNHKQLPNNNLHYAGIGADVLKRHDKWWLIPYHGGALDKQGIINRVQVLRVNEQDTHSFTAEELVSLLRGSEGSSVCITIVKKGIEQDLCLLRQQIRVPSVEEIKRPQGMVVRIRTFRSRETRFLLQQSLKRIAESQEKFYIDLRESSGGDLYEALDCAGLFLPYDTELVMLLEKNKPAWMVKVPSTLSTFSQPLKIRVGPDTASAAEVFAGVLQYQNRAIIIGQKTTGKCISQTDFQLSDGSVLHLSNMEIYYPDGNTCHTKGVVPDIVD